MAIVLHTGFFRRATDVTPVATVTVDPASYREFIFRCALAICCERESAEDVAQEVLLILFKSRARLGEFENPSAWVRRVTVRCATRYMKRARTNDPLPDSMQAEGFSPDDLAVYDVLRGMLPEQRALLGMALNQGLSYREISEALDIPEGTVASRISAAKKDFQKRWEL